MHINPELPPIQGRCTHCLPLNRGTKIFLALGIISLIGGVLAICSALQFLSASHWLFYTGCAVTALSVIEFSLATICARFSRQRNNAPPLFGLVNDDRYTGHYQSIAEIIYVTLGQHELRTHSEEHLNALTEQIEHTISRSQRPARICVTFRGQGGADAGGLTRIYYDDLVSGIIAREGLFKRLPTSLYVPTAQANQNLEVYEKLGQVMMYSYHLLNVIGNHFDLSLFAIALTLSANEVEGLGEPLPPENKIDLYKSYLFTQTAAEWVEVLSKDAASWTEDELRLASAFTFESNTLPNDLKLANQTGPDLGVIACTNRNKNKVKIALTQTLTAQSADLQLLDLLLRNASRWTEEELNRAIDFAHQNGKVPNNLLLEGAPNREAIRNNGPAKQAIKAALLKLVAERYDPHVSIGALESLSPERKLNLYKTLIVAETAPAWLDLVSRPVSNWTDDELIRASELVYTQGKLPNNLILGNGDGPNLPLIGRNVVNRGSVKDALIPAIAESVNSNELKHLDMLTRNVANWTEAELNSAVALVNDCAQIPAGLSIEDDSPNMQAITGSVENKQLIKAAFSQLVVGDRIEKLYDSQLRGMLAIAKGMKSVCHRGAVEGERVAANNLAWATLCREVKPQAFSEQIQGKIDRPFIAENIKIFHTQEQRFGQLPHVQQEEITKKIGWLKVWIRQESTTDEEIRSVLKFITGSSCLTAAKPIDVQIQPNPHSPYPRASTCYNRIYLSPQPVRLQGGDHDHNAPAFINSLKAAIVLAGGAVLNR